MKKILVTIITMCALLSAYVMAAPAAVTVMETVSEYNFENETVENVEYEAELMEYEKASCYSYEFTTSNQGITLTTGQRGTAGANYCAGGTIDNLWNEEGYITAVFHKSEGNTGTTECLKCAATPRL